LEAADKYRGLKHGQAVSLGLVAALKIAVSRRVIKKDILERTVSLLSWCGLPVTPDSFDRETVVRSLQLDKKIRSGRLHFILPTGVGSTRIVDDVSVDEMIATIEKE
jgi:3-dehydroquinate synthase